MEIKRPARFVDEGEPNKKKKGVKKGMDKVETSVVEASRPVTVVFNEGGAVMNMAVTDEELRQFDECEQGSSTEEMDDTYNSETSGDEDTVVCNNNATGLTRNEPPRQSQDMSAVAGTATDKSVTRKKPDESFDVEEMKFMKCFAEFME